MMKRFAPLLTLTLLLLTCAVILVGCGHVTLKPGENGLHNKKNGRDYHFASTVYEAVSLKKEYGKFHVTGKESYKVYTLPDTDPSELLATEDGDILYADGYHLPSLVEMKPTAIRICTEVNSVYEIAAVTDSLSVASVCVAYESDSSLTYPAIAPERSLRVRFESPDYPGFYYTLTYIEYASDISDGEKNYGKYFLYSAFDERFVPVGEEIHAALSGQQPTA